MADLDVLLAELGELRSEVREMFGLVKQTLAATAPTLWDVGQAAENLGRSKSAVRAQCAAGTLPARRIGKKWMIDASALRPPSDDAIATMARAAREGP